MNTTTIRLQDELKARIAALAERSGTTSHGFILEAIESSVEDAEFEAEFLGVARQRWADFLETGKTVSWDETKAYIRARAVGAKARRPAARKLLPRKAA